MMRTISTIFLAVMFNGMVCAQTIENDLLKVQLNGQDISISWKCSNGISVPKLNLAHPIALAKVESGDIEVTHKNGWMTTLSLPKHSPFLHVTTRIANTTKKPVVYGSVDILTLEANCGAATDTLRSLGSGGLTTVADAKGSYTFGVIADPRTRNSVVCAYLTQEQGIGLFFPSVKDGKPQMSARIEFGRMLVRPGKTRCTETLLIGCFDDGRVGLEIFADAVAEKYKIKLPPRPHVYCTWYVNKASDEVTIAKNTAFIAKNLKPFGLDVIQIDDRWQTKVPAGATYENEIKDNGPSKCFVSTEEIYSKGMAPTAKMISDHGMVAGIWFMPWAANATNPYFDKDFIAKHEDGTPFRANWSGHCVDSTHPKGEEFIRERIKRIYDWGYRYFKIDGMHGGMVTHNIYVNKSFPTKADRKTMQKDYETASQKKDLDEKAQRGIARKKTFIEDYDGYPTIRLHDPEMTQVQAYRKCLALVKEEAPKALVLGCNLSQNMRSMGPAFGLVPAMRVGPDNGVAARGSWQQAVKGIWHANNLYFLNGRIWHNDPDPAYVRETTSQSIARWMVSWVAIAGGMHTSSERYDTLPPDRLDILKRGLPGHDCVARPVDYLEKDRPEIWLAQDDRMNLISLFNWEERKETVIDYDMGKLGLDKATTYVGFDFWDNKFIDPFSGQLKQTLPKSGCRILAVKPQADHPMLISTSRHITQGLVDVLDEKWDARKKTLKGSSKVVAGDLYELRIALPTGKRFKPTSAKLDGKDMKIGKVENGGVRLAMTPSESKTMKWEVKF